MDSKDNFISLLSRISLHHASKEDVLQAKFRLREKLTRRQLEGCQSMSDIFSELLNLELIAPDNTMYLELLIRDSFKESEQVIHLINLFKNPDASSQWQDDTRPKPLDEGVCQAIEPNMGSSGAACNSSSIMTRSKKSASTDSSTITSRKAGGLTGRRSKTELSKHRKPPLLPLRFRDAFQHAAGKIGNDWKTLARLVNMPEQTLTTQSKDTQAQALEVMEYWFSQSTTPSLREFRQLLREIPRNDIADDLREINAAKCKTKTLSNSK